MAESISNEVMDKVQNLKSLSPDDWRFILKDLESGVENSNEARHIIYQLRISYDLINDIQRLDTSSSKLSKQVILLTWGLFILTVILVILTVILVYQELFRH